jgi:PAS domain S-box-containing protein
MAEESMLETTYKPIGGGPEESCDMLVGINPLGLITFLRYMNPQAAEKFGYTEKDVIGEHVTDFIIGADSVEAAEHFGRLYASEDAFRAPNREMKTKSGMVISAENYVVPSYDNTGKFMGHYGMVFLKKSEDVAVAPRA